MNCIFLSSFLLITCGVFLTNCSGSSSVQHMSSPGGQTGNYRVRGYTVSDRPWSSAIHRTGGKVFRFFQKLSNKVYGERYWKPWRGIPPNKPFQFIKPKPANKGWGWAQQNSHSSANKQNPHEHQNQKTGTNYDQPMHGDPGHGA